MKSKIIGTKHQLQKVWNKLFLGNIVRWRRLTTKLKNSFKTSHRKPHAWKRLKLKKDNSQTTVFDKSENCTGAADRQTASGIMSEGKRLFLVDSSAPRTLPERYTYTSGFRLLMSH